MNAILAGVAIVAWLNSLWQAAIIAALVWLVLKFLPRVNAATRYVIWWVVLAVVLLLPLAPGLWKHSKPTPVAVKRTPAGPRSLPPVGIQTPAIVTLQPEPSAKWPLALLGLWSVVFLDRSIRIARSYLYLRRVKARASLSPESLPPTGRAARLLLSSDVSSPIAVGFLKPAVILPHALPCELEEAEMDHVLLHEAAHIVRLDDWTNLAARLLGAALALHPVAIWVLRQIEREREIACDDWVVAHTGAAREYAVSLARMYELRWSRSEEARASGIFGRGSRTAQRIELLVRRGREFSGRVSIGRVALSALVLLALTAASARAPRWIAFAQQAPRPSFEVASIKPGTPDSRQVGYGVRGSLFVADNVPLKILIVAAYNLKLHQISGGPKWGDVDRFSIEGKPPAGTPPSWPQMLLMLQSLLEERFKLTFHRETKLEQVYELVVAKGGSKLKESAGPDASGREGIFAGGVGEMIATNRPVAALAGLLSERLGSSVIDKTGLSGKYDFKLSFMPEPTQEDLALFGPLPPEALPPSDSGLPSVFTAVQEQLGLRLEATKGPVEILVIDRAEKPEEN